MCRVLSALAKGVCLARCSNCVIVRVSFDREIQTYTGAATALDLVWDTLDYAV